MERIPQNAPESIPEQPKNGELKKTKKRAARIPIPQVKPETNAEGSQESTEKRPSKALFEGLLKPAKTEKDSKEVAEESAASPAKVEELVKDPEIEDQFSSEAVIFHRPLEERENGFAPAQSPEAVENTQPVGEIDERADDESLPVPLEAQQVPVVERATGEVGGLYRNTPKVEEVVPAIEHQGEAILPIDSLAYELEDVSRTHEGSQEVLDVARVTSGQRSFEKPRSTTTEKAVEDAYYQGKKRGVSKGVLAGGIAGWWLGRRGKRAAQREVAASKETLQQTIKRQETDKAVVSERITAMQQTQEQLVQALDRMERKATISSPELIAKTSGSERVRTIRQEQEPGSPKLAETLTADQSPEDSALDAKSDTRIETSSWHSYEVDSRTGKIVETSAIAYGEAFHQEQKQERIRPVAEPKKVLKVGNMMIRGASQQSLNTPPDVVPKKDDTVSKSQRSSADAAFIGTQLRQRATSPSTWLIAALIVVLLFLLGILS